MVTIDIIFHIATAISYALVKFSDGDTSVVPTARIDGYDDLMDEDHCTVHWTDKKNYEAVILFSGT